MKKITKRAAFIIALYLGAVSAAGCTEKPDNERKTAEQVTEATTDNRIHYEPAEEILNADLRSRLVQIGDTVFRNDGSSTVSEFIEKYGDRFDITTLTDRIDAGEKFPYYSYNPDGGKPETVNYIGTYITSKNDTELTVSLSIGAPDADEDNSVELEDAYICGINAPYGYNDVYYPTGIKRDASNLDYDGIKALIKKEGLKEIDYDVDRSECENAYIEDYDEILLYFTSDDMGTTEYCYKYDRKTHKGISFE